MWQRVKHLIGFNAPPPPPKKKQRPVLPCSDLYDLVLDLDWDQVIQHCQDHPQDAHFQEGDGLETPLYLACQWNPPLAVLQALIKANPEALQWTSRVLRDLPLHMICRSPTTTVEVLQEFVTHYPAGACHTSKYGKTPLQVLWAFGRPQEEERATFWDKMELLVQAVATSRQAQHGYLYRVHAVVSLGALGCPIPVLECICDRYPHELGQRDERGQLPLHIAVGPTQWSGKRKYKPRERATIQVLLQRYPQAARRRWFSLWDYYDPSTRTRRSNTTFTIHNCSMDQSGRYPLQMALANRHCWEGGVKDLFLAAPEVLSILDPVTGLYPFQLAAIPVQDHLAVDVGTIVDLLRQRPDLISIGCEDAADGEATKDSISSTTEASCLQTQDSSSLPLSRQEHENTMRIGLGVVIAIGASCVVLLDQASLSSFRGT